MDLIDDDEWFELGLLLASTMVRLPAGSRLVEAVPIPPFRLAVSAAASPMPNVITRPCPSDLDTDQDALSAAVALAETERSLRHGAVTIALTQTDDGEHYAVAVVGLPGERCSWSTFGLPRGGHTIDIGFLTLQLLEGWALRHDRPTPSRAAA